MSTLVLVVLLLVTSSSYPYARAAQDDGFEVDEGLADFIENDHLSREEISSSKSHLFETTCPHGFFACANGECLSPKWHCDGHYDCDDFSDELNCYVNGHAPTSTDTRLDLVTQKPNLPKLKLPAPIHEEITRVQFNSSQEPLMLFSNGQSIRGYWMGSRILFDVASVPSSNPTPTSSSISQALSILDIFNIGGSSGPSDSSPSRPADTSAAAPHEPKGKNNIIVGVDMDPHDKEVFWVELGKDGGLFSTLIDSEQLEWRSRRSQLGAGRRTLVDSGLLSPEDVALDGLGNNVYLTDAGLRAIVVCSIKHQYCKIIVREGLHKPRAILADSTTGWLIYTDWGDRPGIYLVGMDGKRHEPLITTDIVWPNGIAADHPADQLYWADAHLSKIERVDLATRARKVIVRESAASPFSLSLFENRLYWSDWSGSDIKTCDKLTGNGTKLVLHADNLYGIHIYHPATGARSNELSNPCWSKRCSHLCLIGPAASSTFETRRSGPTQASCACPESMGLSLDRSSCYDSESSFLLMNAKNYIAQLFPERIGLQTVERVIYSREHTIHDVAADWPNYKLFFFDAAKRHIYLAELYPKVNISRFMPADNVRGLLYDNWSENLYWLDPDRGSMSMCPVQGRFELVLRRDLDRPVSLVLDSGNRVFYVASLGAAPNIMRTDILAHPQSDLTIVGTDLGLPVALHLDEQQQRLYWADAKRESIESIDLDFRSSTSGVKAHSRTFHLRRLGTVLAFAVYQDHLLWTVQNGDYVYKAHLHADEAQPVSLKLPPNPSATDPASDSKRILLVDVRLEAGDSPCRHRNCTHGCALDSQHEAVCVCPDFREPPCHSGAEATTGGATGGASSNSSGAAAADEQAAEEMAEQAAARSSEQSGGERHGRSWLALVLALVAAAGAVTLVAGLVLYQQSRAGNPSPWVSHLSVLFRHDKDGAQLLLD